MKKLILVPGVFLSVFLFVSNLCASSLLPPDPTSISLDSMSAVGSVGVSVRLGDGTVAPVLVGQIYKVRVGIKKESGHFSDYSYMFVTKVEPVAGPGPAPVTAAQIADSVARVTISPKAGAIEVGFFTMQIFVKDLGFVEVEINANLGITVTPPPGPVFHESVDIILPGSYYLGQYLEIKLPEDSRRTYEWVVTTTEGSTKLEGLGAVELKTVLSTPGKVEVALTIMNSGGAVLGSWSGSTNVIPEPATSTTMNVNQPAMFAAPSGYGKIAWRLDGKELTESSQSKTLELRFAEKGTHELKCEVDGPENPDLQPMRILTWNIGVE